MQKTDRKTAGQFRIGLPVNWWWSCVVFIALVVSCLTLPRVVLCCSANGCTLVCVYTHRHAATTCRAKRFSFLFVFSLRVFPSFTSYHITPHHTTPLCAPYLASLFFFVKSVNIHRFMELLMYNPCESGLNRLVAQQTCESRTTLSVVMCLEAGMHRCRD